MKISRCKLHFPELRSSLFNYLNFCFWLLCIAILIRLFESLLLTHELGNSFSVHLRNNGIGLLFDIVYFSRFSLLLFPIYAFIFHFSNKGANLFIWIWCTFMIWVSLASMLYYSVSGVPLDNIFLAYSFKELLVTISSSQPSPWWAYSGFLLFPAALIFLSSHRIRFPKSIIFISAAIFIISFFVGSATSSRFETRKTYFTVVNKNVYLFNSIRKGISLKPFKPIQMGEKAMEFQKLFSEFKFTDPRYPFLHEDETEDRLSTYFDLKESKPNFVFIIVEGLGCEFSGAESRLPSATPFLDSLASTGLSWNHCFSVSRRTIGALPAIFGALPFGKGGIMTYKNNIPEFHSLIKILIDNGYDASFFYGGWLGFDNMSYFLDRNYIHHYLNEKEYENSSERTSWGLYDHVLFREAIRNIQFSQSKPRLDIYLTLSTHDPFEYPNVEVLTEKYKQQLRKYGKEKEMEPKFYRYYASFLYLDESLRQLINDYRQKPGFENTVFIITGDHNFNMESNIFEIYQVPLIIWSPMLKESRRFPAIVSHRDISPTFLALMKNKYNIESPEKVAWLSHGLDTSAHFRSQAFCPQMDVGQNMANFIYQDFFVDQDKTYKISSHRGVLSLQETSCPKVTNLFNLYKILDVYVAENDVLIENPLNSDVRFVTELLTIHSATEAINKYSSLSNQKNGTFHGKEEAFFFEKHQFPMSLFEFTLHEDPTAMIAHYQFNLFIPSIEKNNENTPISIVTQIVNKNGKQTYYSVDELNTMWYGKYNQWENFTFKNIFKKSNYNYQKGDKLKIHLYNPEERPFYIANLQVKLEAIY